MKRDAGGSREVTNLLKPSLDLGRVGRGDLVDCRILFDVDSSLSLDNGQGQDEDSERRGKEFDHCG